MRYAWALTYVLAVLACLATVHAQPQPAPQPDQPATLAEPTEQEQTPTAPQPPESSVEPVEQVPTEPEILVQPVAPAEPEALGEGVPVIFRGKELIRIYRPLGLLSPEERAQVSEERLTRLVDDPTVRPEELSLVHGETTSEIMLRDRVVGVIHGVDAEALNLPREVYAEQILALVQETIVETREEFSTRSLLIGLGSILGYTVVFGLILFLLARGARFAVGRIQVWTDPGRGEALRTVHKLTAGRLLETMTTLVRLTRVVLAALFALVWIESVMNALPWTAPYSRVVRRYAMEPISLVWTSFLEFLPNLFFLIVIGVVTRLTLRLVRSVFHALEEGVIRLGEFPEEWAEPTYKMVRVLILALAVVAAFPYIPGSASPAFQGISLFFGLLVSLSSSSAISNIMAGMVLTYTRAFKLEDVVKIGQTVGRVIHKSLLVTDVRTIENVSVSIPNTVVLNNEILNYSKLATDRGLVLNTDITIGYDVPWRQVQELLLAAAASVSTVLSDPPPFVHQTGLNDFYVTYRLNVVVGDPAVMATTYSEMHGAILDEFSQAGVEIMSPHYSALRDGNEVAVPNAQESDGPDSTPLRLQMAGKRPTPPRSGDQ
jgi:small-conductance mechanosensitive channel